MEDPVKLVAEARRLARAGEWSEEARVLNTEVLRLLPDDVATLTRRGRCYFEQGNVEAAKKDYERALAMDPGNRISRNFLDRIGKELSYIRDASRVESMTSFDEAYRVGMGAKGGSQPDYRLAIAALRQAFRLEPRRYEVIVSLAATHRAAGEPDEAERLYKWLLARREDSAAKVGLAAVYRDKKHLVEARKLYESVIEYDESNVHALHGLAGVLYDMRRSNEAAKVFAKAAKFGGHTPRDSVAKLVEIKKHYERMGDDSGAKWIQSVLSKLRSR